jgi:proton-translocating NADH-quinone oxidoreductase chain N
MALVWPEMPSVPLIVLALGAASSYLVGRGWKRRGGEVALVAAMVSLAIAFTAFLFLYDADGRTAEYRPFGEASLRADGLAVLLGLVATGLGIAVLAYNLASMRGDRDRPLYATLVLLLVLGVAGLGLAGDLFNLYVFFELMALASYALVAYHRERPDAAEAGMKYLVMNGAGSLLALVGIGVVYLSTPTGSLDLRVLAAGPMPPEAAVLAAALLIAGFGVKAAVVPMHTWLPDAYTAAPTGITAMMGGVVTVSGLVAMVRAVTALPLLGGTPDVPASMGLLLGFLAILTMTVGNLTAIQQKDLKRMLAYSSVAQVGYILLGFAAGLAFGAVATIAVVGALFHVVNHALMKGGAFLAAGALERTHGTRDLAALRGAARASPWVGAAFGVFVLGLAGVPPMAGFLSKLLIATGAAQGGALGVFFVVALIANSVLSLGYYVPALTGLYSREGGEGPKRAVAVGLTVPVVALAALVLLFGVWPDLALRFVEPAARALGFGGP